MRFCSKPLGAALSIAAIAAVTIASPGRAQQDPDVGQAPPPGVSRTGPEGMPPDGRPPRRIARPRAGGTAVVSAKVNLRSGPGTDSEILASIPPGSTIRVGECEGEWCEVTWNGQSGYAIARNLNLGGSRQAGVYPQQPGYPSGQPGYPPGQPGYPSGQPGYPPGQPGYQAGYPGDGNGPPGYAPGPGYSYGPPVAYGPAYYYGPRVYYGPGWRWRWRRHWW
jgi:hypothetical protein